MDELVFVVLRNATIKVEHSEKLWKECCKSIRKFYNNKIIILDNNSDVVCENHMMFKNCEIINNVHYNNRLYAPFYNLLNIDFKRAIILHDGIIFQKWVDFSKFTNVKFIWHFDTKEYDNVALINYQLRHLTNNKILFDIFNSKTFTGCMGCCLAIEKDFLNKIESTFKLSNLNAIINNQDDAIAFERTITLICFALYPLLINDLSFEGEIKDMVWGYNYNAFINKLYIFGTINLETKSIIKIFAGRK